MEVENFFQYPVASNGRVICTIIVTRDGEELHYNVGDIYVRELNLSCNDNRNRVVVFDEEAFEIGDREKSIRLAFLSNDKEDEHDSEANIFLNLSSKYKGKLYLNLSANIVNLPFGSINPKNFLSNVL